MRLRIPEIAIVLAAGMAVAGCATVPAATQAQDQVSKANEVIDRMSSQPATAALLRNARAALIVLDYARAAFVLGVQGGDGVLVTQHEGHWGDPAFYTLGEVSLGLQLGVEAGPVVYLLMTPRAVQEFHDRHDETSLGADAGLTLARYSSATNLGSSFPSTDVVVWTGTAGLFGGVALDSGHVLLEQDLQKAYPAGSARVDQTHDDGVNGRLAANAPRQPQP